MPPPEDGMTGLAAVVVARRHRPQRVSVCGYLVDTFCLGVKNTLGPELMHERDLPGFLHTFLTSFEAVGQPLAVPLELGRHLVWGRSTTPAAWVSNRPPTSATPRATSGNGPRPAGSRSVATACRSTCPAPTITRGLLSAPWRGRAAKATTTTSSARAEQLPVVPETAHAPAVGDPQAP